LTQNQLPAHLQQYEIRDIAEAAVANLGAAMPPHINIGNGRFTLVDAAGNEIPCPTFDPQLGPYLDACIVDVADVKSRIYYEGAYDSTAEGKRPVCYSDNGIGPSTGSSIPQAPTCAACPRSEWTKINANGNKVPWCTEKYKVALLIPGFPTLFMLAVPPASHGPLREYLATCKGNGVNAANLITRMWFTSQGVLGFMPRPGGPAMAYIDETVAKLRQEAYAQKRTDALVGRNDVVISINRIAAPVHPHTTVLPANQLVPPAGQPVQLDPRFTTPLNQHPFGQAPERAISKNPALSAPYGDQRQQMQPNQDPYAAFAQHPFGQTPAPGAGQGQQFVPPVQQSAPQGAFQQPNGQQGWPGNQQVQQPGFPTGLPSGNVQGAAGPSTVATQQGFVGTAPTEQPAGRRKRRTQAEIAAANGQPAGPQQAPFPHPGQQTAPFAQTAHSGAQTGTGVASATGPGSGQQLEFNIGQGQDASASPEVQNVLNSFFGGQT